MDINVIPQDAAQKKRPVAVLIPYTVGSGTISVYLQKRRDDAKRAPGRIAFFGGGINDGETPQQALLREMQEELAFRPTDHVFFGEFDSPSAHLHVFTEKVKDTFAQTVEVHEGDFGRFFSQNEIGQIDNISTIDRYILNTFFLSMQQRALS